jgi:hypothetical protein
VGITKAITPGLMTEAEQGVKHDARRRRVVIDGSASHMMRSSLPDGGSLPIQPAATEFRYVTYREETPLHLINDQLYCVLNNIANFKNVFFDIF